MSTKMIYKPHPKHGKKKALITNVRTGEAVNLLGYPVKKVVPETDTEASYEVEIRAATQADLKEVYLRGEKDIKGHPIVIAEAAPVSSTKKSEK